MYGVKFKDDATDVINDLFYHELDFKDMYNDDAVGGGCKRGGTYIDGFHRPSCA